MSIVIVGTFLPASQIGGVTNHCTRLARRLEAMKKKAVCINISARRKAFIDLCIRFFSRPNGSDVFHFHTSSANIPFLVFSLIIYLLRVNVAVSFHSGALVERAEKSISFRLSLLYAGLISQRVVVMNEEQALRLRKLMPLIARKILSISSFVFPVKPDVGSYAFNRKEYRISAMGAWLRYYRFEETLYAIEALCDRLPHAQVSAHFAVALFSIDEAYRDYVLTESRLLMSRNEKIRIRFTEDVREPLLHIAESDVFIRNSSVDSYGLCVAEAIFMGRPSIATNVCRRAAGAYLYSPGDIHVLVNHLESIYRGLDTATLPEVSIERSEDAFHGILDMYDSMERVCVNVV